MPRSSFPSREERFALLQDDSHATTPTDGSFDTEALYKQEIYDDYRHQNLFSRHIRCRFRCISRRLPWATIRRIIKVILVAIITIMVATPIGWSSFTTLPPHYEALAQRCDSLVPTPGCANPHNEKVFISVSLYDKGGYLAAGHWGQAVLDLIHILGPSNTFLSIYENDSGPEGGAALEAFRSRVPCKHSIVNEEHVGLSEFQNITMPDGTERMKRLSYLSEIRNRALRPFDHLALGDEIGLVEFDKVLFLNDIAFRPMDAAHLLFSTNSRLVENGDGLEVGKADYLFACALDYNSSPFKFYDVYAFRDAEGFSSGIPVFPFFSHAGQGLSRSDILDQREARVRSCWSGMVAAQAKYLQNTNRLAPYKDWDKVGNHVMDPKAPRMVDGHLPIRFRYEPEIFVDACECCLLLADIAEAASNDGYSLEPEHLRSFVNPYVRVAYSWRVLYWIPWVQHWERLFTIPQALITWFAGLPTHNPHRTVRQGQPFQEEIWRDGEWQMVNRTGRSGMFCNVREMQLIRLGAREEDVNYENVKIPPGQRLNYPT